jgi:hypothetical protein
MEPDRSTPEIPPPTLIELLTEDPASVPLDRCRLPEPAYDRLPIVLSMRGTREWRTALDQWAAYLGCSTAEVIDRALVLLEKDRFVMALQFPLPDRLRPRRR